MRNFIIYYNLVCFLVRGFNSIWDDVVNKSFRS